jgi:glycosyltransferase involved in cell wall biosynthesis
MQAHKVCIFTETYYPVMGGGETQAQLLAEGLVAHGFSVIILTRRSDATLKRVEQFGAITVYRLAPVGRGQLKKWGLILSSLPALIRLRRQYDLVFVSGFRIVGITAVVLAKLLGKKVVLKADSQGEISGDFFKDGLSRINLTPDWLPFKLFLGLRNWILQHADAFTAISPEIAAEMTTHGVDPKIIHPLANSVDIGRFHPVTRQRQAELRRQLGLPLTHTIAIYTGRLVSYKGLPLLLSVWREMFRKHQAINLLLLGTGGLDINNCEAELKNYVEEHNLQQTVCFTGAVQNVPDYLQAADVFVFPTENDALPSSLIEAMACRLPVVTTPIGAIKTIVTNGRNGLSVEPGNFQQLYDALEMVMSDKELASRLAQAGWQSVHEQYTADIVTEKYAGVFGRLIQPSERAISEIKSLPSEK